MPLVSQQDVIHISAKNAAFAKERLVTKLSSYPEVRIVTLSLAKGLDGVDLIAVVETV